MATETTNSVAINIDIVSEKELPKTVLKLAWPVVVEMTFFGLGAIINTILVGRLGASALAAVGLAQQVEFMIQVFFAAIGIGGTAIVARHIGAGEGDRANKAMNQTFVLSYILGLAITVPVLAFASEAMVLMRARPDVVVLGADYIRIISFSILPGYLLIGGCACIRGAGNTRTPMIIMMGVTVCNVVFGYLLIYGGLGFPSLGVSGAALAMGISRLIGACAVIAILVKGTGFLKYSFRDAFHMDFGMIKRIFSVGLPAGIEQIQLQVALTIYTVVISSLGTQVMAAHSLAIRIESLAFMPGFGFGIAAMTLVGQSLGAKKPELAEKAGNLAQRYAMIVMTLIGGILFVYGEEIASIFISDAAVIGLAAVSMKIWAFGMTMMGKSNTLAGGLRGAGDTRWVLLIMTACVWLLRLPLAFFFAYTLELGAIGAWTAAVLDMNARGLFMWRRFSAGKWKSIQV